MTTAPARIETRDMLLIYRVIRREIGSLPGLIRTTRDRPRAAQVAAHASEMLDFLHTHHTGEDELLWPVLRPRITLDDDLIGRMEAQHGEIAATVADVRRWLPGWAASADPETGEKIATRIESAIGVLSLHLAEEEERILPLAAEHFSQREWDALGKHGFAAIPGKRRLVMLGHILQETDEAERQRFMRQIPPPARLAYSLVGRRQYARETAVIHG
ncbi:MAG: hemerythrin domain-containing protein [Streptosporangiaceae bacterium]